MHDEEPLYRSYFLKLAQKYASARWMLGPKPARYPELAACVVDALLKRLPPEQIAGRMRHSGDRPGCRETIYRYVYGDEGKRQELYLLLPWSRRRRRLRGGRKLRGLEIPHPNCIGQRPPAIAERTDFAH